MLKMDPRTFFENYQVTDIEKDPLPLKVLRNTIVKDEIPGQALHWGFDYLDQRSCPLPLIIHILERLHQEVLQTDFPDCVEAISDTLDGSGDTQAEALYEPLKLMRAIVKKLDEICLREKEDYHDSVDGIVESPDMQPHVHAISYYNIKNTRRHMEDRMAILPRMDRLYQLPTPVSYFAVFDGHNGMEAAAYGAAQLHRFFIQSMNQNQDVMSSIADAFENLDQVFVQKCRNNDKIKSGSTVVLSVIMPEKLYVAWLGDSQAVLAKRDEVNNLVTPHKPERKDEIDRIRSLGGEVIQMHNTYRVNGNLAVSRAIGDVDQKTFIISTPDMKMLELDGNEEFLILACDGLWDDISPESAANIVRRQVVADPANVSAVSQKLIQQAKMKGSSDNISVVVVFLEQLESIKNRYEGKLPDLPEESETVSFFKQSPEPIGVVPMEKFIEHGIDGIAEMNGHSKEGDQLVDFLSFGSSKESGKLLDDGNQSGGEDIENKEVEEDLSDAESDDEWQFKKPAESIPVPADNIMPTGNGVTDNPVETHTADLIGAVDNGAEESGTLLHIGSPSPSAQLVAEDIATFETKLENDSANESIDLFLNQTVVDVIPEPSTFVDFNCQPLIEQPETSTLIANDNPVEMETADLISAANGGAEESGTLLNMDFSNPSAHLVTDDAVTLEKPQPDDNINESFNPFLNPTEANVTSEPSPIVDFSSPSPLEQEVLAPVSNDNLLDSQTADLIGTVDGIESGTMLHMESPKPTAPLDIDDALQLGTKQPDDNANDSFNPFINQVEAGVASGPSPIVDFSSPSPVEQEAIPTSISNTIETQGAESGTLLNMESPIPSAQIITDDALTLGMKESDNNANESFNPFINQVETAVVSEPNVTLDFGSQPLIEQPQIPAFIPNDDPVEAQTVDVDLIGADSGTLLPLETPSPSAPLVVDNALTLGRKEPEDNASESSNPFLNQVEAVVAPEQSPIVDISSQSPIQKPEIPASVTNAATGGKPVAKLAKNPVKAEAPATKTKATASTATASKKSPLKSGDAAPKAPGTAATKSTIAATRAAPKSATGSGPASKPASAKSATATGAKTVTATRVGTTTSSRAPLSKDANGVDSKTTTTARTTASTMRARPTAAPTASKPLVPKTTTLNTTTSPKRVPGAAATTTTRQATSRVTPASTGPKTGGDTAAKLAASAIAKARTKPTTLTSTTAAKVGVGADAKKPAVPKTTTSSAKPTATTTAASRPGVGRTLPTSARTAPPAKPAGTARPPVPRTQLKPGESTASRPAGTLPSRTATKPAGATSAKPLTAPKKAEPVTMRGKKPSPGKVDITSKTMKSAINKKVASDATSNEKAELIEQNGLASNAVGENVNALNTVNGGMNGGMNGGIHDMNGETEKQDAIKENGVHLDDTPGDVPQNDASPISSQPVDLLS